MDLTKKGLVQMVVTMRLRKKPKGDGDYSFTAFSGDENVGVVAGSTSSDGSKR
jgi:hypothetical protein